MIPNLVSLGGRKAAWHWHSCTLITAISKIGPAITPDLYHWLQQVPPIMRNLGLMLSMIKLPGKVLLSPPAAFDE